MEFGNNGNLATLMIRQLEGFAFFNDNDRVAKEEG